MVSRPTCIIQSLLLPLVLQVLSKVMPPIIAEAHTAIHPQSAELHSHVQLRALLYTVQWESTLTIASSSPLAHLSSHTVDITKDPGNSDKVFLEDFQVAILHLKSVSREQVCLVDIQLPLRFVVPSQTCVRLARDSAKGEQSEWDTNGNIMHSAIKQVTSGRFGVTANYLADADELQIKMAQENCCSSHPWRRSLTT
ncbi:hypothetical protein C8R48DRAFT_772112 [Suillus tomentosus]|nr:hypothetical protein C8R48DRAFT_772112 [Suillus tomentosus]